MTMTIPAKMPRLLPHQAEMMAFANKMALMGFNGTSGAIAELLRGEIGGRGNYGRTIVQASPDIDALELGNAAGR